MKKTVTLALLFLVASCGVLKKTVKDPYVGSFNFTVFEVDNYGDIPVKLTINKEGENYISQMELSSSGDTGNDMQINSTSFNDGVLTIEATASGFDIYFELTVDGDDISGAMMGMFDIEGTRIKE